MVHFIFNDLIAKIYFLSELAKDHFARGVIVEIMMAACSPNRMNWFESLNKYLLLNETQRANKVGY